MSTVHETARVGFQSAAEAYEAGRPGYPAAALDFLFRELRLDSTKTLLDLAAGTGKLTRQLFAAGARVIAVEPVEAMRWRLESSLPGAEVLAGTAEAVPLPAGSADAVFVAQAFHWFSTHAALCEIHRVLRPGGYLVLMWNVRDDRVPWVAELSKIIHQPRNDTPSYQTGAWRAAFADQQWFGEPQHRVFAHVQSLTRENLRARVASISYVAALPELRREELLAQVEELFAATDRDGRGLVELPYQTHVYWSPRT
ncbi:MAG TPA: class I SAM-dependent methyltransferase [Terriglobales bacterium]|nr:class I SAM-dependent methyltransferase [Terriglobales bacterium]